MDSLLDSTLNSPLNLAHQQERRAESFLRSAKFEEALQCHHKAADLLEEAMKLSHDSKALESLHLQRDYHLRQEIIIRHKQERFDKAKKAYLDKREKHEKHETVTPEVEVKLVPPDHTEKLQYAIYMRMEENDSLLQFLFHDKRPNLESVSQSKSQEEIIQSAIKSPKNDKIIIEELQINNEELRKLIKQLVEELDHIQTENCSLRAQVMLLKHRHKEKSAAKMSRDSATVDHSFLSSRIDLNPDTTVPDLPPLAPLEIPQFNIALLSSNDSGDFSQ